MVIWGLDYLVLGGEKVAGDLVSVKLAALCWWDCDRVKRRPHYERRTPLMPEMSLAKLFMDFDNVTLQKPDLMASAILHLVVRGDFTLEFHLGDLD